MWTELLCKILGECVCSKVNKLPLRCEVAELSWALTALAAHLCHTQHSMVTVGWTGEGRAEHSHLAVHHHHHHHPASAPRGLCWEEQCRSVAFLCGDAEIPHVRGPTVQWEGWNTQPVWKCGCLSLNTVFKHGWIFIHVAEAGLPCKCILEVFHLLNPSCTRDNLQYYFFC